MSLVHAQIPYQIQPVMLAVPETLPEIVTLLKQRKGLVVFEDCLEASQQDALQHALSCEYAQGRIAGYFMLGTTEYLTAYVSPLPTGATAAAQPGTGAQPTNSASPARTQSSNADTSAAFAVAMSLLAAHETAKAQEATSCGKRKHLPTKLERARTKARCHQHSISSLKQR